MLMWLRVWPVGMLGWCLVGDRDVHARPITSSGGIADLVAEPVGFAVGVPEALVVDVIVMPIEVGGQGRKPDELDRIDWI